MNPAHGVSVCSRRIYPRKRLKSFFMEQAFDRAKPIRALGMTLAHIVSQSAGVSYEKRSQWKAVKGARSSASILRCGTSVHENLWKLR
jgi:hypothetical protein